MESGDLASIADSAVDSGDPEEITVLPGPLLSHLQKGTVGELGRCDPETLSDVPWSIGAAQARDGQMGKKMDPSEGICLFVFGLCH